MDPLHPIIPDRPNIPPVTPAPAVRRTSRDARPGAGGQEQGSARDRRDAETDEGWDEQRNDDDSHPHIDVTV